LFSDEDKGIEKVCGEKKNNFVLDQLEQPMQNKNLLYRHDKLKEPTKNRPLSFVLFGPHSPQFQQLAGAIPL
jgi:hypothetical protein